MTMMMIIIIIIVIITIIITLPSITPSFLFYFNPFKGESNGKLPPRTCPGCSVPEPYRSHDWALVPANPASKAEY